MHTRVVFDITRGNPHLHPSHNRYFYPPSPAVATATIPNPSTFFSVSHSGTATVSQIDSIAQKQQLAEALWTEIFTPSWCFSRKMTSATHRNSRSGSAPPHSSQAQLPMDLSQDFSTVTQRRDQPDLNVTIPNSQPDANATIPNTPPPPPSRSAPSAEFLCLQIKPDTLCTNALFSMWARG